MKNKIMTLLLIFTATIFLGCNDSNNAKIIEQKSDTLKIKEVEKQVKKAINESNDKKQKNLTYTKYDSIVSKVFKDVAKIDPENKQMVLIFGINTDPYTDRLKADITNSKILQKKLKNEFSSYYFKAHENLRHKQFHEGQFMDVDTKTMIMIYGIDVTPTIIFTDNKGKAVLVVPGYIPTKQFLVTLDFMKSKLWKNKNRKNGEVYEVLKQYYVKNGINVIKKDK